MLAATPAERLYTAGQSMQIVGQTGGIGYLWANMDADGQGFFKTRKGRRKNLNTEEFKQVFESVLNALISDEMSSMEVS